MTVFIINRRLLNFASSYLPLMCLSGHSPHSECCGNWDGMCKASCFSSWTDVELKGEMDATVAAIVSNITNAGGINLVNL